MPKMQSILVAILISLSMVAGARADDVSVTVNGQTYSCSGSGGNFFYACECHQYSNGYFDIVYAKVDRETGNETAIKYLGPDYGNAQDCQNGMKNYIQCRGN